MDRISKATTSAAADGENRDSREALGDAYKTLAALARDCGAQGAALVQAMEDFEADPHSLPRRQLLKERIEAARAHLGASAPPASRALVNATVSAEINQGEMTGVKVGTLNASTNQTAIGSNIAQAIHGGTARVDSDEP